jgi:lipopolysaccharide export LptBFGC system permease protein LptF
VLFAAIGMPIALASEHRGRNFGLLLVLLAAFAYYALGAIGVGVAESGRLAPALAHWMPNVIFTCLAVALIRRTRGTIPS